MMRGPQTRGGWWILKPWCGQTRTLPMRRKIEQAALPLVPVGSLSACNITNFVSLNIILTKMGLGPWCWWWGWCIAVIVALGHYDKVPAIQRRTIPLSWGIFPSNWCFQWWSDNSRQFQTIPDNPRQFHFLGEFSLATDVGNDDQERGGGVLRRDGPRLRRQVYIVIFFCSNQGNWTIFIEWKNL